MVRRFATRQRALAALAFAAAVPAALAPAAALDAQQGARTVGRPAARPAGWIGIDVDLDVTMPGPSDALRPMVVVQVYDGSPAQRVGLQAGDSILRINQRPVSADVLGRLQASLEPGMEVSFEYRRAGRLHSATMRADARPAEELLVELSPDVGYRVASVRALLAQHMDSATRRGTFGGSGGEARTLVMFRTPGNDTLLLTLSEPSGLSPRTAGDAFDGTWTFTFGTPPASFQGVIARQAPTPGSVPEPQRQTAESAPRPATLMDMQRQLAASAAALATRDEHRRPLAPYLLGQDVIAGATLAPLNDGLAGYFGVSRGLVVLAVVQGTQTADAGVMPGDVIVASAQRSLASIEELRAVFGARRVESIPLTLIRRGRRLEVSVPR